MTREELIAYDRWLTENKWGSSEIITPEQAADLYLAEHPLPPVEGAEKPNAMKFLSDNGYGSGFNYTTKQVANLMQEFAAQPQPTAEGAEEIFTELEFVKLLVDNTSGKLDDFEFRKIVNKRANDFAALHAQRIADKMVSERLREELMRYDQWLLANDMGQMFDDTMKCVDEYLKTREK